MLSSGRFEDGRNEIASGLWKPIRVRLPIPHKFGKHVRRFQSKIASLFYGLTNIATFRFQSLAEAVATRGDQDNYYCVTIC